MNKQETIFGPPGTGKTTATMARLEALIKEGLEPADAVYTSFTRVAADVARDRAAMGSGLDEGDDAYRWFGTLHALCGRMLAFDWRRELLNENTAAGQTQLRNFGRTTGFLFDWNMDTDAEADSFTGQGAEGNQLLAWHAWARQCGLSPADGAIQWRQASTTSLAPARMEQFAIAYETFKRDIAVADFTDVLLRADAAALTPPAQALFVDEAQDLSPLQWRIVDRWASAMQRVVLAGDDDQAIYAFQGADAELFLDRARRDAITTLSQSYRLPQQPWELATWLTRFIRNRQHKPFTALDGKSGEVSEAPLFRLPLAETLRNGETWFLLARNTYLLQPARAYLEANGIAYQSRRGYDPVRLYYPACRAITDLAQKRHIEQDALADLVRFLVPTQDYDPYLTRRLSRGRHRDLPRVILPEDLENLGFSEAFRARLARERTPVRMLTFTSRAGATLYRTYHYLVQLAERHGNDVFSTPPAVTLSTIHGVKGDEADNVALLTDCARASLLTLERDPGSEHRVWYVGATRAKRRLMFVPPNSETNYWPFAAGAWRQAMASTGSAR